MPKIMHPKEAVAVAQEIAADIYTRGYSLPDAEEIAKAIPHEVFMHFKRSYQPAGTGDNPNPPHQKTS